MRMYVCSLFFHKEQRNKAEIANVSNRNDFIRKEKKTNEHRHSSIYLVLLDKEQFLEYKHVAAVDMQT